MATIQILSARPVFKLYLIKEFQRLKAEENPDLKGNIRDYASMNWAK